MKIKLLSSLKYLACLACFLSLFPLIALANGAFSKSYSSIDCLLQLFYVVIIGFIGYAFSFFFQNKRRKKPVPINLLFILTCIIPVGITYYLLHSRGIILSICMLIITLTAYILGGRIYYQGYGNMISNSLFFAVIIINICSIFILWKANKPYSVEQFIGVFLCISALFGLTNNQSNIDFLMQRRQHKFENLPQKIRFYNIKLMLVIFGIILFCFILRNWIVTGIYWILDALREIIRFIFYLINLIASLFQTESLDEEPVAEAAQQLLPVEKIENNSFDWLTLLFIVALIVLLFNKRKQILRFIINAAQKIIGLIKRLLNKSYEIKKPITDNEYYYDNEEFIKPDDILNQKKSKGDLKQWRKSCKSFYKMNNSTEKFRIGFGLVISGLKLKGIKIDKSQTTNEILEMSRNTIQNESYSIATDGYNSIRYGSFDFEINSMENLIEALKILDK